MEAPSLNEVTHDAKKTNEVNLNLINMKLGAFSISLTVKDI